MKKILVPTDFSVNSKAGLQFAIQLASPCHAELIFVHVFHHTHPLEESEKSGSVRRQILTDTLSVQLRNFVADVYREMGVNPGPYACELLEGIGVDNVLLDYCRKNTDVDLICISTRGAGKLTKVLGTHTGNLLSRSVAPVMAVPAGYHVEPLKDVLYATDLADYDFESNKVQEFANQFKLPVEVVHFQSPKGADPRIDLLTNTDETSYRPGWRVVIKEQTTRSSLIEDIQEYMVTRNPSITVLFTNQGRTFLQRLFNLSRAERLAFEIRTPLLIFSKRS